MENSALDAWFTNFVTALGKAQRRSARPPIALPTATAWPERRDAATLRH
jgi:hypothetical protein